jgi:chorismate mutase-like protein
MDELLAFRKQLDEIDDQLMSLLTRRFSVCRQVGAYKAQAGIPMMQPDRVASVKDRAALRAESAGLRHQFGHDLYDLIITEACRLQDEIIASTKSQH